MKKQSQLGLVVEGKSGNSAILRLPRMPEELGPVKSATLRVARRLSNMLHAGYAVAEYEELQAARLILLRVPDSAVPRIVDELCSAELDFPGLAFVLCETWLTSDSLAPLRERGSTVATVVSLLTPHHDWFVVEGKISAVRLIRRFLQRNEMRTLEIRAQCKPLLFGAELLATVLPQPLFATAQEVLRACGISGNPLSAVLEDMAHKMFHNFSKGGRLSSGGPLTQCSPETVTSYLDQVRKTHPEAQQMIDEYLEQVRARQARIARSGWDSVNGSHTGGCS